ncbi:MAG: hypothetical protein HRU69_07845 [Flammeovirgaceae bacterium]|nr:MAG: hypothetical protein HRU69_07845 [Flammeovirgaceae bacterium]
MLIRLLSGSVFFIIAYAVSGQLQQSKRYEIPISDKEAEYHVASAKTNGALIYRYSSTKRNDFLDLIHLDTAFNELWKNQLELEKKFILAHQRTLDGRQYMLFYHREFTTLNFYIYSIQLKDGALTKYQVENYIPFVPTHLEVTSKGALIGGYYIGHVPVVLYFSFTTLRTNVLPGLVNETGELIQIRVSDDDSFQILIGAKNFMKQRTIWIKLYNPDGTLKQNTSIQPPENSSLLFGKVIETGNDNLVVAGTYGNRTSEYSKGLFIVTTNNQGDQVQYLYPFTDLENFFNYMKAKRQKRIKEKIERRKIKGKKIRLQYRILVHELVLQNNQYLLLGEAFYPVYKRDDRYNYGLATSLAIPYIFDGYRYTHAIVIGFNQQGKLQWDNSFEINDVKTFTLEQFVKMDAQSDKIALLYLFDNRIRTKILQGSKILEGKNYNPLKLDYQPEDSGEEDTDIRKLDYWYDGTFLAYGVERPPSRSMSRSRQRIFFINKVTYR